MSEDHTVQLSRQSYLRASRAGPSGHGCEPMSSRLLDMAAGHMTHMGRSAEEQMPSSRLEFERDSIQPQQSPQSLPL